MKVTRWLGAVVVLTGMCAAASASAQEKGQAGVTAGSPGLGVIWHASDNVALRAELTIGLGWGESKSEPSFPITVPNTSASSVDNHSVGTALSALFYLGSPDNLRPYFTPRFEYSRASATATDAIGREQDSTTSSYGLSGSFGARYLLGARFSVFGEVGLAYSRQKGTSIYPTASSEATSSRVSTRTGVGVAFYF